MTGLVAIAEVGCGNCEIAMCLSLLEAEGYADYAPYGGHPLFVTLRHRTRPKTNGCCVLVTHSNLPVISDLQIVCMLSLDSTQVLQSCIGYVAAVYQSEQDDCLVLPNLSPSPTNT